MTAATATTATAAFARGRLLHWAYTYTQTNDSDILLRRSPPESFPGYHNLNVKKLANVFFIFLP